MQRLFLAVVIALVRLVRSETHECKTYDYLQMLFAKFKNSGLSEKIFTQNFTDENNQTMQARLKICQASPESNALIYCTNHSETNREIALAFLTKTTTTMDRDWSTIQRSIIKQQS